MCHTSTGHATMAADSDKSSTAPAPRIVIHIVQPGLSLLLCLIVVVNSKVRRDELLNLITPKRELRARLPTYFHDSKRKYVATAPSRHHAPSPAISITYDVQLFLRNY
ncbi:unnamed protein product, partial [Brenthis ino]